MTFYAGRVSKSYIPGKGWVPATQAGKRALRGAKGGHAKAKGLSEEMSSWKKIMSDDPAGRVGARKTGKTIPLGRGNHAEVREAPYMGGSTEAFAYMKGKKRIMVTKPNADPRFVKHEAAHLSPKKRKPHRLVQINQSPQRVMREEARADKAGGFEYRKAPKPKLTKPFQENYSGYASSANSRQQASMQRAVHRPVDSATNKHLKAEGINTKSQRAKMFNQKSLGEYRTVQDKIDSSRGIKHKVSAKTHNRINRTKDVAYPALGATALGTAAYAGNKRSEDVRKSYWGVDHGSAALGIAGGGVGGYSVANSLNNRNR